MVPPCLLQCHGRLTFFNLLLLLVVVVVYVCMFLHNCFVLHQVLQLLFLSLAHSLLYYLTPSRVVSLSPLVCVCVSRWWKRAVVCCQHPNNAWCYLRCHLHGKNACSTLILLSILLFLILAELPFRILVEQTPFAGRLESRKYDLRYALVLVKYHWAFGSVSNYLA